mmetsp:Transcript_28961/g.35226  ORF Transcript_28961/g.35226 Transcript_28961/m.35226 type:complete len:507 (-) Transcript_28961:164-1684(-)|eukprot:CAMPEP_0172502906 /NCGR_PEP_ID=MMETSP1066-20121228/164044_1 /TAXON_ID=671091 /ORGANISM="Coscinodiscus wailesii, Strain CCMP2513" /LENGTH=506 /DNA_ID=CAMNT_0013278369 /DNA_START=159 /DNA_END=1679 /DNA_ORIENTATION=-
MSESASIRSGSTCSSRYRTVSCGSSVDESLFGHSRCDTNKSNASRTSSTKNTNAVYLTSNEFNKIKNRVLQPSNIHSNVTSQANNNTTSSDPRTHDRAVARKKHMVKLAQESLKNSLCSSSSPSSPHARNNAVRASALAKMEEKEDIVKLLRTCSARAVAFTIRDDQIRDTKIREKMERDYERRMDLSMEVDRLREMEEREAEEKRKLDKRVLDRKVIEDQILEREKRRLLEEEERERENKHMLAVIAKFKREDEEAALRKREQAKQATKDVIEHNRRAEELKRERQQIERDEEEMFASYQAQRDEQLRKREEEEREKQRQKKELQKKLLESQTKSMDEKLALDELRARRAQNEKERKHREAELAAARKKKRDIEILHAARQRQDEERRQAMQREEQFKRQEYESAIRMAHDMAERERREAEETNRKNEEFRQALQKQIEENEDRRRRDIKHKRKEGVAIAQNMKSEKEKLEQIRDRMVQEMKDKGINEKYFCEMKSIDIEKFLMK